MDHQDLKRLKTFPSCSGLCFMVKTVVIFIKLMALRHYLWMDPAYLAELGGIKSWFSLFQVLK